MSSKQDLIDFIKKLCADTFEIDSWLIETDTRKEKVVFARHFFCLFLWQYAVLKDGETGRLINKERSTVTASRTAAIQLYQTDTRGCLEKYNSMTAEIEKYVADKSAPPELHFVMKCYAIPLYNVGTKTYSIKLPLTPEQIAIIKSHNVLEILQVEA